jgi:hypothetical protein
MFPEYLAVYEIIWKKYGNARQAADDNIIRRMRITGWITKATDTHSECVILIAFSQQQWLRERASVLRLYVHYVYCVHILNIYSDGCTHTNSLLKCTLPNSWKSYEFKQALYCHCFPSTQLYTV